LKKRVFAGIVVRELLAHDSLSLIVLSVKTAKIKDIVQSLLEWFSANARDLPWRRTRDPYAIWVSEIMLQQTQVKTVIPYWERWMRALPTISHLAVAKSETLHKLWEGLGYYTRVRNLQKAAQQIMTEHSGQFPREYESILNLAGIGRYTAGAISSIAFNQPQSILDGNVIRVLTRVFGIAENPREKTTNELLWKIAQELVTNAANSEPGTRNPELPLCSHLNQSLMELGALVCTPKQPKCTHCPVRKHCDAFRTNRVEQIPNLGPRVAATERQFVAFVIEQQGKYLVRQRPAGQVNAHLWEFPNVEVFSPDFSPAKLAKEHLEMRLKGVQEFCAIRHTITRYRITLRAFHAVLSQSTLRTPHSALDWLSLAKLDALPFTSAHRKILNRLVR
jgi:A/G-specific adenine glycosylase